jgi:hypothetical protein
MSVHIVEFKGDLPRTRNKDGCDKPHAFYNLNEALAFLIELFLKDAEPDEDGPGMYYPHLPDPEDDRIIVWEAHPDSGEVKAVWQFSGWHWEHDAADLPGGPLPQGKLPGLSATLYELATRE